MNFKKQPQDTTFYKGLVFCAAAVCYTQKNNFKYIRQAGILYCSNDDVFFLCFQKVADKVKSAVSLSGGQPKQPAVKDLISWGVSLTHFQYTVSLYFETTLSAKIGWPILQVASH